MPDVTAALAKVAPYVQRGKVWLSPTRLLECCAVTLPRRETR